MCSSYLLFALSSGHIRVLCTLVAFLLEAGMFLIPSSTAPLFSLWWQSKLATFENVRESVALGWIST